VNVFIFVVNYRTDNHLLRFVDSLQKALSKNSSVFLRLCIYDNSEKTRAEQRKFLDALGKKSDWIDTYFSPINAGYFGGLVKAQEEVPSETDCVIYCNPDVSVADDFFLKLQPGLEQTKGLLAPTILSEHEGIDLNPMYRRRLSRLKLLCLSAIFSSDLTYMTYGIFAGIKDRMRGKALPTKTNISQKIYASHGSFFIFTDIDFFRNLPVFPCFLFGEELFIAEEARLQNVPILYEPQLRVFDTRHASIRLLKTRIRRGLVHKSIQFIINSYY